MRTQSTDTAPEIERLQILRIRAMPLARKFASIRNGTAMLADANMVAANAELAPQNADIDAQRAPDFVARQYGVSVSPELAAAIDRRCGQRHGQFDILAPLFEMTGLLHDLRCHYALVGQLACALYGFPRPAFTIEMLTTSSLTRVAALAARPGSDLLLCEPTGANSLVSSAQRNACAHLDFLHLPSLVKITIQLSSAGNFNRTVLHHGRALHLVDGMAPVSMATPEHIILLEIMAFQRIRDDDRWNDMLGVLKVQSPSLNLAALSEWGERLGISQLLQQALQDAGIAA